MPFWDVEHLIHKATKYYVKEVQQQILRFRHTATAVNVGLQRCAKHHYAVMHIVECLKHIIGKETENLCGAEKLSAATYVVVFDILVFHSNFAREAGVILSIRLCDNKVKPTIFNQKTLLIQDLLLYEK